MWDLLNRNVIVLLKTPVDAVRTDWKSSYIDLEGFSGVTFDVILGAFSGEDTNNYLTLSLYEYDPTGTPAPQTSGNYGAVAAAKLQGAFHNAHCISGTAFGHDFRKSRWDAKRA